jgi:hypothetical protein
VGRLVAGVARGGRIDLNGRCRPARSDGRRRHQPQPVGAGAPAAGRAVDGLFDAPVDADLGGAVVAAAAAQDEVVGVGAGEHLGDVAVEVVQPERVRRQQADGLDPAAVVGPIQAWAVSPSGIG